MLRPCSTDWSSRAAPVLLCTMIACYTQPPAIPPAEHEAEADTSPALPASVEEFAIEAYGAEHVSTRRNRVVLRRKPTPRPAHVVGDLIQRARCEPVEPSAHAPAHAVTNCLGGLPPQVLMVREERDLLGGRIVMEWTRIQEPAPRPPDNSGGASIVLPPPAGKPLDLPDGTVGLLLCVDELVPVTVRQPRPDVSRLDPMSGPPIEERLCASPLLVGTALEGGPVKAHAPQLDPYQTLEPQHTVEFGPDTRLRRVADRIELEGFERRWTVLPLPARTSFFLHFAGDLDGDLELDLLLTDLGPRPRGSYLYLSKGGFHVAAMSKGARATAPPPPRTP